MENGEGLVITDHAYVRSKERIGLKKSATERLAEKAMELGLSHAEAKGSVRSYIDKLYLSHHQGNNIRIYGEKVYIFEENRLITVLNLPNDLKKAVRKMMNRKGERDGRAEARTTEGKDQG